MRGVAKTSKMKSHRSASQSPGDKALAREERADVVFRNPSPAGVTKKLDPKAQAPKQGSVSAPR